jgi:CheY-like chemotaxis protein
VLSGTQEAGDGLVAALLEQLVENPSEFTADVEPKTALYRLFLRKWNCKERDARFVIEAGKAPVRKFTPESRQAYLLLTIGEFERDAIAGILETDIERIVNLVAAADAEIARSFDAAEVLIMEDEPLEAFHLEDILSELGYRVVAVARTSREAIELAKQHKPQLIFGTLLLADGNTGVEAVKAIQEMFEVPVIYVTGFPEALLTGSRPEPAFVIRKPYGAETVRAIIAQMLFLRPDSIGHVPQAPI